MRWTSRAEECEIYLKWKCEEDQKAEQQKSRSAATTHRFGLRRDFWNGFRGSRNMSPSRLRSPMWLTVLERLFEFCVDIRFEALRVIGR